MFVNRALQAARLMRWRFAENGLSTIAYAFGWRSLNAKADAALQELRFSGVCIRPIVGDRSLFNAIREDALRRYSKAWDGEKVRADTEDWKQDRSALATNEAKDFLLRLLPPVLTGDSVYLRYALQEGFLDIADAYLRMRVQLRAVQLWLNYPTLGDARSTQLWHRDTDDLANLKVFTYLTDVDELSGPFAYAPETHPFGARYAVEPRMYQPGRADDTAMEKIVPRGSWMVCAGPAGTTVLADTCGFHKGVKPIARPRLMLVSHYTSPAAFSGSDLAVEGGVPDWCSRRQRAALATCAR